MLKIRSCAVAALLATSSLVLPAHADQAAEAVLHATSAPARDAALAAMESAAPDEPATHYVGGAVRFFIALEGLALDLNRHGFESPQSFMLPLLRLPVPPRPDPEPLTYDVFRAIIGAFRDRMEAAAAVLAKVPADADIALDVDLARLGVDLDGDEAIGAAESVAAIIAAITRGPARQRNGVNTADALGNLTFRFDRADGYWLEGYANFLIAQADFWLAHDFQDAFDNSFHMLFPKAGLPLQDALVPPFDTGPANMIAAEWRIADFVSFIHLARWPVVEPERRRAARTGLLEMIRLSRENWKAIRAETDNEREWLPGPHQPGVHRLTGLEVGEEQVAAWHEALRMAEDLLEGRRLLPHFRIAGKGMNMKRFFEEPEIFDLVLLITGPGFAPYLEEGDVLTAQEWSIVRRQFGAQGFLPFAIWFN